MNHSFGPQLKDGRVLLRCWAPGAQQVEALLQPGNPDERRVTMAAEADGFFSTLVEGGAGLRYLFARDGGPALPDPASRWQPHGVHAPSEVLEFDHDWRDHDWLGVTPEDLVIYELHLGTFSAAGTYGGAAAHLEHLADLGVTAIEIMPLAAFPGRRGWGYDGTFHFAPFAGYGSPRELQELVDACHQHGLAVILDLVTNHFGPEGNAMWGMAPLFFRPDRPTAWSSGINWEAEPVHAYFEEVVAFWAATYHIDGIRFDAFHAVPFEARGKHLQRMLAAVERELAPDRRFTVLLESVDNQSSLLQWPDQRLHVCQLNFDWQRASHALLTGERHGEYQVFHPAEPELQRCLDAGFSFRGRFTPHYRRVIGEPQPPASWNAVVNYLQNHDTVGNRYLGQRLDRLTDAATLEAATALLLLHPGIPMLFMGQEWSASSPFFFFTDLPEHLLAAVRSGRRSGFRELDGERSPQQAPSCDEDAAFEASMLRWEELSSSPHCKRLALVRELLQVRRRVLPQMHRSTTNTKVLADGRLFLTSVPAGSPAGAGYLLAANLQDQPARLSVTPGPLVYSTRPLGGGELPAWTTALFEARL